MFTSQQPELLDAQKELLSFSFNSAMAYTNLILGAGYAGFFATWAFSRDYLSAKQALWTALLVTISLLSFVLFEVYKSFHVSRSPIGLSKAVTAPANLERRLREFRGERRSAELRFGIVWAIVFPFTLVTGLAGALVLAYAFVTLLFSAYG